MLCEVGKDNDTCIIHETVTWRGQDTRTHTDTYTQKAFVWPQKCQSLKNRLDMRHGRDDNLREEQLGRPCEQRV